MKFGVLFKRGLFLFVLLSLVCIVNGAHTAVVTITPTNLLETNISDFSLSIQNLNLGNDGIVNITLNLDGFEIINILDLNTWIHINSSNMITWYNSTISGLGSQIFLSSFQAQRVSSNTSFVWTVNTKDNAASPQTNSKDFTILVTNDPSAPILNNTLPISNSFTKNNSQYFSIDVQDPETGIDKGDLSYTNCGNSSYINQPMGCSQTNCNSTLDISLFNDGDLCYYYTIYNRGGSSNQTDLFLLNIDRTGPQFDLTDLAKLNNTNDKDGILEFNFSLTDDIGVKNCFLFLSNGSETRINTTDILGNITYDVSSTNDTYTFYIQCYDQLGNPEETPTYRVFHDTTLPSIDELICNPPDGQNGDGNVLCNITVTDITGIDSCSLYINDILDPILIGSDIANNFSTTVTASNDAYSRYIKCNDNAGNEIITNKTYFYFDNIAPIISSIKVDNSLINVMINWNTDELSNTSVYYENSSFNSGYGINNSVYNHSSSLLDLVYNTTYDYIISSADRWGNIANSTDLFNTIIYVAPSAPSGGGGGGGSSCTPDWTCLEWNSCINGQQTCAKYEKTCNRVVPTNVKTQSCTVPIEPQQTETTTPEVQGGSSEVTGGTGSEVTGFSILDNGLIDLAKSKYTLLLALLAIVIAIIMMMFKKRYPTIDPKLIEKDLMNAKKPEVKQLSKNQFNNQMDYRKGNLKRL